MFRSSIGAAMGLKDSVDKMILSDCREQFAGEPWHRDAALARRARQQVSGFLADEDAYVAGLISEADSVPRSHEPDVTASIAGALLGVHPYATPNATYFLKAGIIATDPEETPPMRRGRLLEPVAVRLLREEKPDWKIEVPRAYYRDPELRLGATPDVFATNEAGFGVIQIKSVEPSRFRRTWFAGDAIEPPTYSIVQANIEAFMTGASWAAVAALVVGFGIDLHIVPIPIHAGIIDRIKAEVAVFWRRVERREPYPFDYAHDGDLIARLFERSEPGKKSSCSMTINCRNWRLKIANSPQNLRRGKIAARRFAPRSSPKSVMPKSRYSRAAGSRRRREFGKPTWSRNRRPFATCGSNWRVWHETT
jgi:hypothetical protein